MLAQVHFPQTLYPEELDRYLFDGWFRMGQTIFTTNFLHFKQEYFSAIWLRLDLQAMADDKKQRNIFKLNSKFAVEIQPARLRQEHENLFARYRQQVDFEPSSSVHVLLYGKGSSTVFNTYEVNVYDGARMIAAGFFDLGRESAAGITSFYDPDYKKFSLGKFLIYLKAEYCRTHGLRYFYPGYFVPGYAAFDYKLTIHPEALQFLELETGQWKPIAAFREIETVPLRAIDAKLECLQNELASQGIESRIVSYDYFDANLIPDLNHMELFDFPRFLHFYDFHNNVINSLVVFDVRDQRYHWMVMRSVWMAEQPSMDPDHYTAHLLKVEEEVVAMSSERDMASALALAIRSDVLKQRLG